MACCRVIRSRPQHTANAENIDGRTLTRQSGVASYNADSGGDAAPAGTPRSQYFNIVQGTSNAAYGLITSGPKAFTTFSPNGVAMPLDLAGNCFKSATGALTGAINGTCVGTAADPGDQNDTREFTQGLYRSL